MILGLVDTPNAETALMSEPPILLTQNAEGSMCDEQIVSWNTNGVRSWMSHDASPSVLEADHKVSASRKGQSQDQTVTQGTLKEMQQEDSDLRIIRNYLLTKVAPTDNELFLTSSASKKYYLNKEQYFLDKDQVVCKHPNTEGPPLIVVPRTLCKEIIRLNHNIPAAGHQGVERTKSRIKRKYYWYQMSKDIASHVTTCQECIQFKKGTRKARHAMITHHAGAPMERVHLDFLGPLPKTPRGNEYILMMVDQFTKWVECIPLPSQTAEVTARASVNAFFSRFGYPLNIFTDQGRNFESNLFQSLCDMLHIHKSRTTAYRPSSNGQVERYNRTIMDSIRCFVDKSQNSWDLHLPQLAGALRSAVNRHTGFTANQMMLGHEVNCPAELMYRPPNVESTESDPDSYVDQLREAIHDTHELARKTLHSAQVRMKRDYDLRVRAEEYTPDELVLILDTAVVKGKNRKLSPPWKGPLIITNKVTSYLYKVQDRKRSFMVNHDRMKKYLGGKVPRWIETFRKDQRSSGQGESTSEEERAVYCSCQQPWGNRFMIQCDACETWYHGECVNITETDADDIDEYICDNCLPLTNDA